MQDEHEQHEMALGVEAHTALADGETVEIEHETKPERRRQDRVLSVTVSFDSDEDRRAFVERFGLPAPVGDEAQVWSTDWPLASPDHPDSPSLF